MRTRDSMQYYLHTNASQQIHPSINSNIDSFFLFLSLCCVSLWPLEEVSATTTATTASFFTTKRLIRRDSPHISFSFSSFSIFKESHSLRIRVAAVIAITMLSAKERVQQWADVVVQVSCLAEDLACLLSQPFPYLCKLPTPKFRTFWFFQNELKKY